MLQRKKDTWAGEVTMVLVCTALPTCRLSQLHIFRAIVDKMKNEILIVKLS